LSKRCRRGVEGVVNASSLKGISGRLILTQPEAEIPFVSIPELRFWPKKINIFCFAKKLI
jgi:hypothetical protein